MNTSQSHRLLLIAIVIVIGGAVVAISSHNSSSQALNAKVHLQHDEAGLVKNALAIYYVKHNAYPSSLSGIYSLSPDAKSSVTDLSHLKYAVSGDGQTYQFTYEDQANTSHTVSGNYQKDLH